MPYPGRGGTGFADVRRSGGGEGVFRPQRPFGDGEGAPLPSLRLIQAPVFHGYSSSVWVSFESSPTVADLELALATAGIEVRSADEEPPNNVGAAGQSGLTVGDIRKDRNNPRAFWFWLVADNLRLFAETGVAVLKECL